MLTAKYMQDLVRAEENELNKNKIISCFYEFCYLYPSLRFSLLRDDFEIKDEVFKSCYFVADILNIDRNNAQQIIDDYCAEILFQQFASLFYEKDCQNIESQESNCALVYCLILAHEAMLSEKGFKNVKNAILHTIDEEDLGSHPNYNFVINLLQERTKEKTKINTISFGTPLNKKNQ